MAPHSSTLAWKIPWMEEPGRLQSMGSLRVGYHFHFSLSCIGEGNGNPLQCSHLENPRDRGAWWAAVYGVAQSRTRLSDLAAAAASCVWSQGSTSNLWWPPSSLLGALCHVFHDLYFMSDREELENAFHVCFTGLN